MSVFSHKCYLCSFIVFHIEFKTENKFPIHSYEVSQTIAFIFKAIKSRLISRCRIIDTGAHHLVLWYICKRILLISRFISSATISWITSPSVFVFKACRKLWHICALIPSQICEISASGLQFGINKPFNSIWTQSRSLPMKRLKRKRKQLQLCSYWCLLHKVATRTYPMICPSKRNIRRRVLPRALFQSKLENVIENFLLPENPRSKATTRRLILMLERFWNNASKIRKAILAKNPINPSPEPNLHALLSLL